MAANAITTTRLDILTSFLNKEAVKAFTPIFNDHNGDFEAMAAAIGDNPKLTNKAIDLQFVNVLADLSSEFNNSLNVEKS